MADWKDKDVLILSPAPVFPQNYGNRVRIFRICERLKSAGARLHFVHYASEADWRTQLPINALQAHAGHFTSSHLIPPTRPLHTGAIGTHHLKDEWWDPAIGQYLDWLTRIQRFDAAIVNYTWLSRALTHLPDSCLKILDTHDLFSGRKELFIANGLEPEFFYMEPAEEAEALARADVVWAIKREEAEIFARMTDRPVMTVPHIDPVQPLPARSAEFLRFGLFGANNNLNRENFEAFLDAAVQHVRQHLTQFEIVVAGSVCKVLRPRTERFITFLGYVDDAADFYRAVDAVLVPMRFSTGLKIKTAEALAFGKPVLSLEHAFEGFHPTHPAHGLQDNAQILAEMSAFVREPARLESLAQASLDSAALSEAEVQEGLAQTLKAHDAVRHPAFWMVVSAADFAAAPMLLDHALEAAEFLRHLFPSFGFLFAGPSLPDEALCGRLAAYGSVVAVTPADGTRSFHAEDRLPAALILADPEQVRRKILGLWLTTRHGLDLARGLPPGAVFVSGDALSLSLALDPAARDVDLLEGLQGLGAGLIHCSSSLPWQVLPVLAQAGAELVLVPFLRAGGSAPFLERLRAAPIITPESRLPAPPAEHGFERALLDASLAIQRRLADLGRLGRAGRYRAASEPEGAAVSAVEMEYLLRLGSLVDPGDGSALMVDHEDLDHALRADAGWARVWVLGGALKDRFAPDLSAASIEPEVEKDTHGSQMSASAAQVEDAFAGSDADMAAWAEVASPYSGAMAQAMDPSGPPSTASDDETQTPTLPQAAATSAPTLGFSRLDPDQTLGGHELYFGQMRVYVPAGLGLHAVDVQFLNLRAARRQIQRLVMRFFFEQDQVRLFLRRNDCSEDAFQDGESDWQVDDWGPFLIYRIEKSVPCVYRRGLAGGDAVVLAEMLNAISRMDDTAAPRLAGGALDGWLAVTRALAECDLHLPAV